MSIDPRVLVLEEMRKQTALLERLIEAIPEGILTDIHNLIVDVLDKVDGKAAAAPAVTVDLDNAHGNPIVKAKDPRDWTGDPMNGRRFSECPPTYLDLLAERYDYFASKEEDAKKKRYNELDAARARGWSARLRAGWTAPTPAALTEEPW